MNQKKLSQNQSWNGVYIFFRSLWESDPKKFSSHGYGLGAYLNFANASFNDDYEWRRSCLACFQRPWEGEARLSPEGILMVASHLVGRYIEKYQFELHQLKSLLQGMANNPSHQQWELWHYSLNKASEGEARKWFGEYRFSEWCDK